MTSTAKVTRAVHGMGVAPAAAPASAPRLGDLSPGLAARIKLADGPCRWVALPPYDKDGYAKFGGKLLHRLVWLELAGEIPAATPVLDHVAKRGCTSRACVWPPHLEPVTVRINTLRGTSFAAVNFAKDECDHGHEFDLLNTYWWNGHRACRKCRTAASARYKSRLVAASLPEALRLAA